MRVLMINSVCGIRSTGRICTDLADILSEQGHEVKIAYGRETVPQKYKNYAVRIGSEADVKLHALRSRIFDDTGFGSKKATERFIEWVKQYDPDVIHLHNIHGYYINIEVLFNYLHTYGKQIIWTLHDCWAFTGHCTHFDFVGCDKWQTGCYHCAQLHEYPASQLKDRSKRNYAYKKRLFCGISNMTIVTPSEWLADLVTKSFLSQYPVVVIHNGIDTDIFRPTESDFRKKCGLEDKKIILGVASVWNKRKGFDDFRELAKLLDSTYKIILVGLTDKQIKRLPCNIIGISRTNNTKELAEIYTTADVFVNPTYEDNYPTTNLEAQACGIPCLTYRTGGSVESVPQENVIEVGNLKEVYDRRKISQKLSNQDFSKAAMLSGYLKIYNNSLLYVR